jgi:diguanylate cyclase (GGDEF)-like protein
MGRAAGRKALRRRIDGSSDRELAVALLATIAIVGPLLAFFTYLFPHPAGTDFVLPTILFCAAILSGVVLWVRRDTVGWPMIRLGVAVITAVMISVADRSAAYLAYYVWLGVFAFYFLRPAWALATAGWIAALDATAVAIDSPPGAIELWINGAATVLGVGLIVLALRTRIDGLVRSLESEAATDDLTGPPNRRAFDEQLARELRRAHRDGGEVALALLDLDRFKQLNDSSGHLAGDRALQVLADVIRNEVRGMDWPARVGGDEFAVLLPRADAEQATRVADRLRAAIEDEFADGPLALLASVGVATSGGRELSADQLLAEADGALYAAKGRGGGRVFTTGSEPEAVESPATPAGLASGS